MQEGGVSLEHAGGGEVALLSGMNYRCVFDSWCRLCGKYRLCQVNFEKASIFGQRQSAWPFWEQPQFSLFHLFFLFCLSFFLPFLPSVSFSLFCFRFLLSPLFVQSSIVYIFFLSFLSSFPPFCLFSRLISSSFHSITPCLYSFFLVHSLPSSFSFNFLLSPIFISSSVSFIFTYFVYSLMSSFLSPFLLFVLRFLFSLPFHFSFIPRLPPLRVPWAWHARPWR